MVYQTVVHSSLHSNAGFNLLPPPIVTTAYVFGHVTYRATAAALQPISDMGAYISSRFFSRAYFRITFLTLSATSHHLYTLRAQASHIQS
jgi:hypothetical protein